MPTRGRAMRRKPAEVQRMAAEGSPDMSMTALRRALPQTATSVI